MSDKKMLGEFIYKMRKEKQLSQSELGELVGVSNKAVSKWETDEARPDLGKVGLLAEALGVTVDELLKCEKSEMRGEIDNRQSFFGIKGISEKTKSSYEFVSDKKSKKGKPYLHVNLGRDENGQIRKANGLIAIGVIAKGLIAMGLISSGIISFGIIATGLIAFGMISLGLLAVGSVAGGIGLSIGGVAIGVFAVGGVAIGVFAVGGVAVGAFSIGGLSIGYNAITGEFGKAIGIFTQYIALRR